MTIVLWSLLALLAVTVVWQARRMDWTALRNRYRTLPNQSRSAIALLVVASVLLMLRGFILIVLAREAAVIPIATGGLLVMTALVLAHRLPRK